MEKNNNYVHIMYYAQIAASSNKCTSKATPPSVCALGGKMSVCIIALKCLHKRFYFTNLTRWFKCISLYIIESPFSDEHKYN